MSTLHLVLSGGPCTGKTSIGRYLQHQFKVLIVHDGAYSVEEVAALRARGSCLVVFLKARPATVADRAGLRRVIFDLSLLKVEEIADEKILTDGEVDEAVELVEAIIYDYLRAHNLDA